MSSTKTNSRVCIVGLDEPEYATLRERLGTPVLAHEALPRIMVRDGELLVESTSGAHFLPVAKMVFHGIFENDHDFIAALALWNGLCLPNARAMLDCRLKLPCLVRALAFTRFGTPLRGYAAPGVTFEAQAESVAKWGDWHCGENKERFTESWTSRTPCIIEPFLSGQAVRVVVIGDRHWQIRLDGDNWLKSIHHPAACLMPIDDELLEDTRTVGRGFGLEIVANDYIVTDRGSKHLLEVNHIPNVTRFPELWQAYCEFVIDWIGKA